MAERLVIGHWPVLVGYAALPWVVEAARHWRTTGKAAACGSGGCVPLGSLSASAGLATAGRLVAFAATPRGRGGCACWRHCLSVAQRALARRRAPPRGRRRHQRHRGCLFALQGEGSVPAPLAALTPRRDLEQRGGAELPHRAFSGGPRWSSSWRWWSSASGAGGADPGGATCCVRCCAGRWAGGWPCSPGWCRRRWPGSSSTCPGAGPVRDGSRLLSLSALAVARGRVWRLALARVGCRRQRVLAVVALLLAPSR